MYSRLTTNESNIHSKVDSDEIKISGVSSSTLPGNSQSYFLTPRANEETEMFKNKLESMSSDIYTLKSSVHKILEHLEKLNKNKPESYGSTSTIKE